MSKQMCFRIISFLFLLSLLSVIAQALGSASKVSYELYSSQKKELEDTISLYRSDRKAEALSAFKELIQKANPVAEYYYATYLEFGEGIPKNIVESEAIFKRVFPDILEFANKGDVIAQQATGWMYVNGKGVEKNEVESIKWFRKAADQGYAVSQLILAGAYREGKGVEKNDAEAARWYLKSAEQGNVAAQTAIGWMYDVGAGVSQDYGEAIKWYQKSAAQGHPEACLRLGLLYSLGKGVGKDPQKAAEFFEMAANKGNTIAQYDLGSMYEIGSGVKQDSAAAVKWYTKAAEQGCFDAQTRLGDLYSHGGLGVAVSHKTSSIWYCKAAAQNEHVRDSCERETNAALRLEKEEALKEQQAEEARIAAEKAEKLAAAQTQGTGAGTTTKKSQETIEADQRAAVLIEGLRDNYTAKDNARSLVKMGASAVPELRQALKNSNSDVRGRVLDILDAIGPAAKSATPELIDALGDSEAGWVLSKIGASAVPSLIKALTSEDKEIRSGAAYALGHMGSRAKSAVPALTKMLDDTEGSVCISAIYALGEIGPEARTAAPALKSILNEPERSGYELCDTVTEAAAKIGIGAISVLEEGLTCANSDARRAAAIGLERLGPAAVPILVKSFIATPADVGVVNYAGSALLRMGPKAESAIPELAKGLSNPDSKLDGANACYILGKIGINAIPTLTKALSHPDSNVRSSAAKALGRMGPKAKAAAPALKKALSDTDSGVRQSVATALGLISPDGR